MNAILLLKGVRKAFGPVQALRGVDLTVYPGEVHALIGENGAGKSTLMKILSGAYRRDSGELTLEGKAFDVASPAAGRKAGIAMIYQELTLAPHLSIEENVTLGLETTRLGFLQSQAKAVREALAVLGHGELDLRTPVRELSIGVQQLVEMARAMVADARVIILDEPTSSLSEADKARLFGVIRTLRARGIALIYISHFLDEVMDLADRYTVLRDGETVGAGMIADTDISGIIGLMIGRSLDEMYPRVEHTQGEVVLTASAVTGKDIPIDAGFTLRRGEILGIAGLVGAGRTELLRTLFGLDRGSAGTVLRGERRLRVTELSPRKAMQAGLNMLSENRKEEGLAVEMTIAENLTLSALRRLGRFGFVNLRLEQETARQWCSRLSIRCRDARQTLRDLSGGNQQKVALARLLYHDSDILFLDEPTRGVDVGSKAEIYRLAQALAVNGKAVIFVSSYLPELFGVCDTLAVMHRGRLSAVRPIRQWTEHEVMHVAATGDDKRGG